MSYYLGTPFGPGIVVGQVQSTASVQYVPVRQVRYPVVFVPGTTQLQSGTTFVQPGIAFVRQQPSIALQHVNPNALTLQAYDNVSRGVADEARKNREYQDLLRARLQGQR